MGVSKGDRAGGVCKFETGRGGKSETCKFSDVLQAGDNVPEGFWFAFTGSDDIAEVETKSDLWLVEKSNDKFRLDSMGLGPCLCMNGPAGKGLISIAGILGI